MQAIVVCHLPRTDRRVTKARNTRIKAVLREHGIQPLGRDAVRVTDEFEFLYLVAVSHQRLLALVLDVVVEVLREATVN